MTKENYPVNPAWLAERIPLGTRVRIKSDAVIDAIVTYDGRHAHSPYRDNHPSNPVVNSAEAEQYLGEIGVVTAQGPAHQPQLLMDDGAVVWMLYRSGVEAVEL